MPKLSTGSNRYLKAQLRPLTKPTFWASAGLFGVSLFALANLFQQPNAVLNSGDRNAIANLDQNESLTPEERARAADIDDLSVLLKDLDKNQTIDSVSNRINQTQTTNLEAPEAIADLDSLKPAPQVEISHSQFTPLPPVNITLTNGASSNQVNSASSAGSGFIGFDPRSSGQVGMAPSSATSSGVAPLTAALERYSAGSSGQAATPRQQNASADSASAPVPPGNDLPSPAVTTGQRNGLLSNGVQPNGSPTYTAPLSAPGSAVPNGNASTTLSPQNSVNNAYTQLFNPNLVIPSTPTPTQPVAPSLPSQPATGNPNLSEIQSSAGTSSGFSQTTASPANAAFGAPSGSSAPAPTNSATSSAGLSSPAVSNPAPFSVPNNIPGQYSGSGRINTFANP